MNIKKSSLKNIQSIIQTIQANRNFKGRKKCDKTIFRDCMCAFDIETTSAPEIEQSFMYVWQFAILHQDNIWYVVGRTWEEFVELIESINDSHLTLLIWVHNLSYEFQFMRHWLDFPPENVFCIRSRKILKASYKNIEFRCSYIQTNKSLAKFTSDMRVSHEKLDGVAFDYSKTRYPWTPLSEFEERYAINDVVGLLEAMQKRMEMFKDTVYSIPLTSTGYVRRQAKEAMTHYNFKKLHEMMCDETVYKLLRMEFRGGDTHANRYHVNTILENVDSWDRASSYPDVMVNYKFPMSKFIPRMIDDINYLVKMCNKKDLCFLAKIQFINLRQKDIYYGAPYLSSDKAFLLEGDVVKDNGRVLKADRCGYVVNDIDFDIISSEYVFDDVILECVYTAKYDYLPEPFRKLVIKLFEDKTSLKNLQGKEVDYMKSKELINALYGMCAQNPVREIITYTDEENPFRVEREQNIKEALEKYNKKAFLLYAWGCWTTAHARKQLKDMINIVGDNFVYCDTDSVKFLKGHDYEEILEKIAEHNKKLQELSERNGGFAHDKHGKLHFLGVYEQEKSYSKFATLGAKKYAFEYPDGSFGITIAGVPKKSGAKEMGCIENFKTGFVFSHTGKLESRYNDIDYGLYNPDGVSGHDIMIKSNTLLRETTYELGVTAEYSRILESVGNWNDFMESERIKRNV